MDRVSRSGTRIVYGSGVTFRHQNSIWIGVSRSDTRIVMDRVSRSDTRIVMDRVSCSDTRIEDGSECHVPTPGLVKRMNLEIC